MLRLVDKSNFILIIFHTNYILYIINPDDKITFLFLSSVTNNTIFTIFWLQFILLNSFISYATDRNKINSLLFFLLGCHPSAASPNSFAGFPVRTPRHVVNSAESEHRRRIRKTGIISAGLPAKL